jgi:hypothetical protein
MQCIRHSLEHTTSQQPTPARHERIFLEKFIFAPEESHRSNRCLKVHTAPSVHWSPQRDDSAWSLTGTLFKLGHLPVIRQLTPGGLHQQSDVAPCRLRDASRSGDLVGVLLHNAASGPSRHLYPCTPYSRNRPSAVIARIDATRAKFGVAECGSSFDRIVSGLADHSGVERRRIASPRSRLDGLVVTWPNSRHVGQLKFLMGANRLRSRFYRPLAKEIDCSE